MFIILACLFSFALSFGLALGLIALGAPAWVPIVISIPLGLAIGVFAAEMS